MNVVPAVMLISEGHLMGCSIYQHQSCVEIAFAFV